ncbi:MAG: class I SAM-dependent methyltransferase [Bacteroidota bacterium]
MKPKYDNIGIGYNLTRKADRYLTEQLLHHLQPSSTGLYLDIGCGTGNYTHALQQKGFNFIGIDPSPLMLEKAKSRNKQIDWRLGSAENTGLPDTSVDGIIGSLTIHHWANLKQGFTELYRVLKPSGRIVIFTSTPQQMKGYWLNHYFPKMLVDSIAQMPSLEKVTEAIAFSGLDLLSTHQYAIHPDLEDHFLYCGKHDPERYFDQDIRQGISSFSSLSNRDEVENGLAALRKDMDSGKVIEIIQSYENDLGDYLYLIGQKPALHPA